MQEFTWYLPTKVYFGEGMIEKVGEETKKFGKRALVVTGKNSAKKTGALQKVENSLRKAGVEMVLFEGVEPNPSLETVEKGAQLIKKRECEVIVGLGGGSAMDAAKGMAILFTNPAPLTQYFGINKVKKAPLPVVEIPTTAGTGSEVTPYAVLTDTQMEHPQKRAIGDPLLFPQVALVDPQLTLTLPTSITADTGIDALSHAIEGYTSNNSQPVSDVLALKAVELLAHYLPEIMDNPENTKVRSRLLYASLLAGMVIAQTGTILVHGMSYRITTDFGLPHGRAIGILLPWVCEFNLSANYDKFVSLARSLGENIEGLPREEAAKKAVEGIQKLILRLGLPQNLKDRGIEEKTIRKFAEEVMQNKRKLASNPRPATLEDIIKIYQRALWGK
ncbi:alcohol dehydrogenase [Candidatus Aerophobetes bacterium]|uniref:Alcohol dehydrogenase n=1 Tax=Aerophobetes bacterium TaxID=2030807 RepID=A0A662CYH0_UNCAE|nr:MAG: alcohol dehydrogenase [Candidatus Aerophobetes bacterium]